MIRAYLAGPDVFLPNAAEHAAAKVAICARHGILGCPPVDEEIQRATGLPPDQAWRAIYARVTATMEASDLVIANLTPFRGASADSGTLVELGWFLGRGRPAFGYSNTALPFEARSRAVTAVLPDPMPDLVTEGFGLPDNLMVPGAVLQAGGLPIILPEDGLDHPFDGLDTFARCVAQVAETVL